MRGRGGDERAGDAGLASVGPNEHAANRENAVVVAQIERAVHATVSELRERRARGELHPADGDVSLERDEAACTRLLVDDVRAQLGFVRRGRDRAALEPRVLVALEVPVAAEARALARAEQIGERVEVSGRDEVDGYVGHETGAGTGG